MKKLDLQSYAPVPLVAVVIAVIYIALDEFAMRTLTSELLANHYKYFKILSLVLFSVAFIALVQRLLIKRLVYAVAASIPLIVPLVSYRYRDDIFPYPSFIDSTTKLNIWFGFFVLVYVGFILLGSTFLVSRNKKSIPLLVGVIAGLTAVSFAIMLIPNKITYYLSNQESSKLVESLAYTPYSLSKPTAGFKVESESAGLGYIGLSSDAPNTYYGFSYTTIDENSSKSDYAINSFAVPEIYSPPQNCVSSDVPVFDIASEPCELIGRSKLGCDVYALKTKDEELEGFLDTKAFCRIENTLIVLSSSALLDEKGVTQLFAPSNSEALNIFDNLKRLSKDEIKKFSKV